MIIANLNLHDTGDKSRLSADVTFEDSSTKSFEIYFEVSNRHRKHLRYGYEPFVLACFPVALYKGERRIKIDGDLCPELASNINAALCLQKKWWGSESSIPTLEANSFEVKPITGGGVACFISGGVDSLSNFCRNTGQYDRNDPRRIKYGIFVYGLDIGDPNKVDREDVFETGTELLRTFLDEHGCELIPVCTNARDIESDGVFYEERHFGSILGGIAHSLAASISLCQIALDLRADYTDEWGSHPWLNKYFSSSFIKLESTMDSFTRIEKYNFFKSNPRSLDVLRVCYNMRDIPQGRLNCCYCQKCVRTKVELLAQGLLDTAATFHDKEITREQVKKLRVHHYHDIEFLQEPIPRLRSVGADWIADYLSRETGRSITLLLFKRKIIRVIKNVERIRRTKRIPQVR